MAISFATTKVNCDLKTSETAYSSRYPYHTDYDHDSGHDSYGKHASSYGNHGHGAYGKWLMSIIKMIKLWWLIVGALDKYGDNGYGSSGLEKYSKYGSKGAHGNYLWLSVNKIYYQLNSQLITGSHGGAYGHKHGYGLYSRNRGYGYEKHYAYDKEV